MAETQVTGTTFNEKWIEGGTANPSPIFNVDIPTFWPPMPVISGIVSGFCERADLAISGITFTGNENAIAQNVAAGTVPNATMSNLLVAPDTPPFGPPIAASNNYMKTVDAMLTHLVDTGVYVDVNGTTYGTFTNLATAAQARATAYSSACGAISSDGGALCTPGSIAYPELWAEQRKWMLDELRFVLTEPAPTQYCSIVAVTNYYLTGASAIEATAYTSLLSGTTAQYTAWINGCTDITSTPFYDGQGMAYFTDMDSESAAADKILIGTPDFWQGSDAGTNTVGACISVTVVNPSQSEEISLYLEPVCDQTIDSVIFNESGFIPVTASTTATSAHSYAVKGGTLSVSASYTGGSISVYANCGLVVTKGAAITGLNIMDTSDIVFSGFIHGTPVGNTLWSNLFINYYPVPSGFYYFTGTYCTGDHSTLPTTASPDYLFDAVTGMTISNNTSLNILMLNGSAITLSGECAGVVAIGPGCSVIWDASGQSSMLIAVFPGGTLTYEGRSGASVSSIIAYRGSVVNITGNGGYMDTLCAIEGSTVNITSTNSFYIGFLHVGVWFDSGITKVSGGTTEALSRGWNYFDIPQSITGSTVEVPVAGSTALDTAQAAAKAALPNVNIINSDKFAGTCILSGNTISFAKYIENAKERTSGHTFIRNSMKVLAVGGGPLPAPVKTSVYEGFQCRQSEHDLVPTPPLHDAASLIS